MGCRELARKLHTFKHHTGAVFAAAFSPDGKTLVSAAADQTVKLWNVETGQRIATLTEANQRTELPSPSIPKDTNSPRPGSTR